MFPLSRMSLSTPVNISKAVRSCIICEVELQADALSDTHTELKMIVTLVLGSHTPTTISLGSTTLEQIREMDAEERRGERDAEVEDLKLEMKMTPCHVLFLSSRSMLIESPEIRRFCDFFSDSSQYNCADGAVD